MSRKGLKGPAEDVCFHVLDLPVVSPSMLYRCSLGKRLMMRPLPADVIAEQKVNTSEDLRRFKVLCRILQQELLRILLYIYIYSGEITLLIPSVEHSFNQLIDEKTEIHLHICFEVCFWMFGGNVY